jgi:carboxyl-terminal processing protease
MKLALLLVSLPLCHSEAVAQNQAEDGKPVYRKALSALAIMLPRDHPAHHPLNDEIARRWFDLFIRELDPRRVYFTAKDIRRFAEHRGDLDDHARRGDLSFADLVRDTYVQRLRQATRIGIELLDERHDFTRDERFELHPESFPAHGEALRDRWRKRVKYEILVERSSGLTMDRAVAKLRARYRRMARENQFDDDEELYELFLDAFTRSFGPHNRYLGEGTLERFRS